MYFHQFFNRFIVPCNIKPDRCCTVLLLPHDYVSTTWTTLCGFTENKWRRHEHLRPTIIFNSLYTQPLKTKYRAIYGPMSCHGRQQIILNTKQPYRSTRKQFIMAHGQFIILRQQMRKSGRVVYERQSPRRKTHGLNGWVKQTALSPMTTLFMSRVKL